VSFRFKTAAAVAVGTFNIYIVQPNWLAQIGILDENTRVKIESDFTRPGFRFSVPNDPIQWNVRPDRLVLEATDIGTDCGGPLAKVLRTLRWTPLTGVGANFEYEADWELLSRLRCKLPDCPAPKGFEEGQKTWHAAFARGSEVFNFQVSANPKPKGADKKKVVTLSLNVHTEISQEKEQTKASELAQLACRQFIQHGKDAVLIAQDLVGIELH